MNFYIHIRSLFRGFNDTYCRLRTELLEFNPQYGQEFFFLQSFHIGSGAHSLAYSMGTGGGGIKRLRHEADHYVRG
jgi:hypothetical protein